MRLVRLAVDVEVGANPAKPRGKPRAGKSKKSDWQSLKGSWENRMILFGDNPDGAFEEAARAIYTARETMVNVEQEVLDSVIACAIKEREIPRLIGYALISYVAMWYQINRGEDVVASWEVVE